MLAGTERSHGAAATQWGSTRVRAALVKKSAFSVSSSSSTTTALDSSSGDRSSALHETATDTTTKTSCIDNAATADDDGAGNENERNSANAVAFVGRFVSASNAKERENDDDSNEWEDVDDLAFRDLPFVDASDSEYAPSDNGSDVDDEDDSASDPLSDDNDDEVTSPTGLFASVTRHWRSSNARRPSASHSTTATVDFDEPDRAFWATAADKQRWVAQYRAADQQFARTFGCHIDAPARPDAAAQLRREKRTRRTFALVLAALCAVYLAQLVAMYVRASGPVAVLNAAVDSVAAVSSRVPDAVASAKDRLAALLAPVKPVELESLPPATAHLVEQAPADAIESRELETRDAAASTPVATTDTTTTIDTTTEAVADEASVINDASSSDLPLSPPETMIVTTAPAPAAAAVELCSKLLTRLVQSKYDAAIQDGAVRACDAAVALAASDAVEPLVLRGDLASRVSDFAKADADYQRALAVAAAQVPPRTALLDALELKAAANRWIEQCMARRFRPLRREVTRVAADADSSAPLRALASDWLSVFKKQKTLADVLTITRVWTFQRLAYDD